MVLFYEVGSEDLVAKAVEAAIIAEEPNKVFLEGIVLALFGYGGDAEAGCGVWFVVAQGDEFDGASDEV